MRRLVHFFLFDAVWFIAIVGRAEWLWLTAMLVLVLLATGGKELWDRRWYLLLLITVGVLVEFLFVAAGVISFVGDAIIPTWLVLLWVGFSAMVMVVLDWMYQRYALAFLLGAVFGPITYITGERLGAASFHVSMLWVVLSYAVAWGLLMVLVAHIVRSPEGQRINREQPE